MRAWENRASKVVTEPYVHAWICCFGNFRFFLSNGKENVSGLPPRRPYQRFAQRFYERQPFSTLKARLACGLNLFLRIKQPV
jgi:hypothetical protein